MPLHTAATMISLFFLGFIVLATCKNTTVQLGCVFPSNPTGGRNGGNWITAPYYAMKQAVAEINNNTALLPNYQLTLICNSSSGSTEGAAAGANWHVTHGSIAILGIGFTYEAIPISYIASPTMTPVIAMSATAASLHNNAYFPSFQRLIASDTSYDGVLISLCQYFGWKNLVVVYSTDDYGISFNEDITTLVQNKVSFTFFPVPYTSDATARQSFIQTGQAIKKLDTRIVFMMTTPIQAVLESFSQVPGLFNGDFVFILNQDSTSELKNKTDIQNFVGGMLQLVVSPVNNSVTTGFQNLPFWNVSQPNYVQNTYDAVYVVATALDTLVNKIQAATNTTKLPPLANLTAQIRNTSLQGSGGLIQFCGSDRLVMSWTINSMPIGGPAWQPVLTATTNAVCVQTGNYSQYTITPLSSAPIIWSNGLTKVPVDRQPAQVLGLQTYSVVASLSLILCGVLVILFSFVLTNVNARTRVIKGSSVLFCNLILVGVLIALIALLIETTYNRADAYACTLVPGLLALSFDVTFGSLFAKTWRLHKIFKNAQHLKRSVITNAQVFMPVVALILFDIVVISIWSGIDLPTIDVEADPIRAFVLVQRCDMDFKGVWFSLLIIPKLGVLIYGMQISYQVRNIDKVFRESKSIAVAIIALFLCGAITTPVLLLVWQQIDAAQILLTIGITLSLLSVVLVLFVPKFWKIYTVGSDADSDKSSVLDGTSHSWKPDQQLHSLGGNSGAGSGNSRGGNSRGGSDKEEELTSIRQAQHQPSIVERAEPASPSSPPSRLEDSSHGAFDPLVKSSSMGQTQTYYMETSQNTASHLIDTPEKLRSPSVDVLVTSTPPNEEQQPPSAFSFSGEEQQQPIPGSVQVAIVPSEGNPELHNDVEGTPIFNPFT